MSEDPRKTGLKNGLRQLTSAQLRRVINYPGDMVLDEYNFKDGKFCPLAVGLGLHRNRAFVTHEAVFNELTSRGYRVYNTRGIDGEFYTTNRKTDLLVAAIEVIAEKNEHYYCDWCDCEECKSGGKYNMHTETIDGSWICNVCYDYECCVDAVGQPCDSDCGHRPKLKDGKWVK